MNSRFWIKHENKLITHIDRGIQFSSKIYNDFTKKNKTYIILSLSRENIPTNNVVAERFIRTFKKYLIDENNL